jgi:hypothetical protein
MQFGRALFRILQQIACSGPRLGPVYLSKIDIVDRFYRIAIHSDDIAKLAIVFPNRDGEEQLISLPLVLPMGCKQYPPLFTAATETVADLVNAKLRAKASIQAHHLDEISESPIILESPAPAPIAGSASLPLRACSHYLLTSQPRPVKARDVYVDDFIGMVQGSFTVLG